MNRIEGELGVCKTGRWAILSSYGPHFGEESPLVGRYGSGTIFFASCNLLCSFCQNYDISHLRYGDEVSPNDLATVIIRLQKMGCHNINFVTPTHVVPQILEALPIAIEAGLNIPLVYNCGGYETLLTLRLLDGVFDIYMPDFKFWNNEWAEKFCGVTDYRERAQEALLEMHRQVGDLIVDERGIAKRGLIIRHLVMPQNIAGTEEIVRFIATKISPHSYVNIMAQYRPCGRAVGDPFIGRRITPQEFADAIEKARRAGLYRLDKG
ncbi:MAG: radical SAM protein [Syntrophales bacterium]|nr:radical SAM protein [Syntrophales bacterium]